MPVCRWFSAIAFLCHFATAHAQTANIATTNAVLKAWPLTGLVAGSQVIRTGFNAAGDSDQVVYSLQTSACSISGGDNGSQVASNTAGNCWIGKFPSDGVDIRDFGALDYTGSTDVHTAFQAAVTACGKLGGGTAPGCTVKVPPGSWLLSSPVTIAQSNTCIFGNGESSLIVNGSASSPAIIFGDGITRYTRNCIKSVGFGQSASVTATTGNMALDLVMQGNLALTDVFVTQYPAALSAGIVTNNVTQSYFTNIDVQNTNGIGILFANNTVDIYMTNSHSDANALDGIAVTDSNGLYFANVTAYNNNRNAWHFYATNSHNYNIMCTNCVGDTSGSYNWHISDLTRGYFSNIWGCTQQSTSINTYANGMILNGSSTSDILISGGVFDFNNNSGVYIYNFNGMPQNITLYNVSLGASQSGHGNGLSGTGYGLQVDSAATKVTVDGGMAVNNRSGPYLIGSGASVNIVNVIN